MSKDNQSKNHYANRHFSTSVQKLSICFVLEQQMDGSKTLRLKICILGLFFVGAMKWTARAKTHISNEAKFGLLCSKLMNFRLFWLCRPPLLIFSIGLISLKWVFIRIFARPKCVSLIFRDLSFAESSFCPKVV